VDDEQGDDHTADHTDEEPGDIDGHMRPMTAQGAEAVFQEDSEHNAV